MKEYLALKEDMLRVKRAVAVVTGARGWTSAGVNASGRVFTHGAAQGRS